MPRGYLIDSNVLVLLVVGRVAPRLIGRHRRLKQYSQQDFLRLERLLAECEALVVTPNILTESSNLLATERRELLLGGLQELIDTELELTIASVEACQRTEYRRLGLADAALLALASPARPLLTADNQLYAAAVTVIPESAVYFRVGDNSHD